MRLRKSILFGLALVAATSMLSIWWSGGSKKAEAAGALFKPDDAKIVALGEDIYADNCASCHGANLEGEPNWRMVKSDGLLPAPPHDETGHTWHHPEEQLFGLTKYGLAKMVGNPDQRSGMPIFDGVLSDEEIIAVLSFIKSTWPQEVRARHDEMERRLQDSKQQ